MAGPIDFSKTQRIVLLIDLNPLLKNPNNPSYITSILNTSKILLSFPSLSSSLFSFKLFFSSLSPLRSSSSLHRLLPKHPSASTSLSFNNPSQTLVSLSSLLNSISPSSISAELTHSPSNASHTASSLLQLVHDYDWESQIENLSGTLENSQDIRSNLIILFSPICRSLKCLAEFMCIDINDESLKTLDGNGVKFRDCFSVVNDAFVSRDIHVCWIDVDYEIESHEEKVETGESVEGLALFENQIRSFGWGFCSTNSVVLGSALIPFGLIYPNIGMSFKFLNSRRLHKRIHGQLSLEISDVSGKPLECKSCDLELLQLKVLPKIRSNDIIGTMGIMSSEGKEPNLNEAFWGNFTDGIMRLHVKALQKLKEREKIVECSLDHFLVQGLSAETGKSKKKCVDDFFADRVLKLLSSEKCEFFQKHSVPIWQILLNFLYREGYWALLSISNSNGDSCMGILKPFTVHSGFLSIIDHGPSLVCNIGGSNLAKIENVMTTGNIDMKNCKPIVDSQIGTSPSQNDVNLDCGKRRKNKKHVYQDLTWSSFSKAAFGCFDLDLAEVYFAKDVKMSKKLKFLKCWMKQVKKSSHYCPTVPDESCQTAPEGSESYQLIKTEIDERFTVSQHQESEEPLSMQDFSDHSRIQEDTVFVSCSETSEEFFRNLPKKVQHGLESNSVDLQILAERLVNSSIYWLRQKREADNIIESQTPMTKVDDSSGVEVAELTRLLLRVPKNLKVQNNNDLSCQASSPSTTSENIVREYELQILLRMEILQSEFAEGIKDTMKQKLVKQICSLLEIIQYLVEGGFHGHVSLYDYVEKTIKARYSHNLGDVVNRIYDQMDLLPFGDENEAQVLLLNSEDSNQSWRDKQDRDEIAETNKIYESVSAEDESSHPLENVNNSPQGTRKEEHARKLSEARERRERARRFVSFTSRMPDLQRVWAPKQSKAMKVKAKPLIKESKRKKQWGPSYSVVCETPMTGKRPLCSQGDEEHQDQGSTPCTSVYKALFQE